MEMGIASYLNTHSQLSLVMSNFIAGHHGHSGVHVMDHRANTDVCALSWRWCESFSDKKMCFLASQKTPYCPHDA